MPMRPGADYLHLCCHLCFGHNACGSTWKERVISQGHMQRGHGCCLSEQPNDSTIRASTRGDLASAAGAGTAFSAHLSAAPLYTLGEVARQGQRTFGHLVSFRMWT